MAELVEKNMEQMLPFIQEIKNNVDTDQLKEIVRRRRHHEYKIVSKTRIFDIFEKYIDDEFRNLQFIRTLKFDYQKSAISDVKRLIKRIVRQITVHFESEPKAFLYAIGVSRDLKNTTLESKYWLTLLQKHGHVNPHFYLAAASSSLKSMRVMDQKNQEFIFDNKYLNIKNNMDNVTNFNRKKEFIKQIKDLKKSRQNIESETKRKYVLWARSVYHMGIRQFPTNTDIYYDYMLFELNNYNDQKKMDETEIQEIGDCRDGRIIDVIVTKMIQISTDVSYFTKVLEFLNSSPLQLESIDKMRQIVATSKMFEHHEPMIVDEPILYIEKSTTDHYSNFLNKYPEPKFIRAIAPKSASNDLLLYLQSLKVKMENGELAKGPEMVKVRNMLDFILSDQDWASESLDLWWEYFILEKTFGNELQSSEVLQRAQSKLKVKWLAYLTLRKIKCC